jgi:hypothetical protein
MGRLLTITGLLGMIAGAAFAFATAIAVAILVFNLERVVP